MLKKLATIERLTDAETQAAVDLCRHVRSVPWRKHILHEGDNPTEVHLILKGCAARYKTVPDGGRRLVGLLLPGDFCDIHVTTLAVMDHSIVTITPCEVGYIDVAMVDAITRSTPVLTRAFWRSILVDESIMRQWLVNSRRDTLDALAYLLCELHAPMQLVGLAENDRLSMPATQEEIADVPGVTSVHVNRVLQILRKLDFLELQGGERHVPDVEKLRAFCRFDPTCLHLR